MKIFLKFAIVFSSVSFLIHSSGDYETPFPLGTSDLIPDSRINEHFTEEVNVAKWVSRRRAKNPERSPDDIALLYSGYFIDSDLADLRTCEERNEKLMDKILELELRLSKLEEYVASELQKSQEK